MQPPRVEDGRRRLWQSGSPPHAFRDGEWVEVVRVALDHPLERCAPWYFAAKGSGVWWSVGKTLVTNATQDDIFPTWWHKEKLPDGAGAYTTLTRVARAAAAMATARQW